MHAGPTARKAAYSKDYRGICKSLFGHPSAGAESAGSTRSARRPTARNRRRGQRPRVRSKLGHAPGNMLPMPRIILAMPPLAVTFFIIFCICLCCLISRPTSCTWVPEPRAMRRLREPLIISGSRRSPGVIELMIASICLNCFSAAPWALPICARLTPPSIGSLSMSPPRRPCSSSVATGRGSLPGRSPCPS